MDKKILGKRISALRNELGISQDKLAEYLGVDQSLICRVEKGERFLEMSNMEKLASLFCKTIDELLDESMYDDKYQIAFRANNLSEDDFIKLTAVNKIILNHRQLEGLIE